METGIDLSSTVDAIVGSCIGKYHRQWQIDKAKATVTDLINALYDHVVKHGRKLFVSVRSLADATGKSVSTIQKWLPAIKARLFKVLCPAFWREDLQLTNLAPRLECRQSFWSFCQSCFLGHSVAVHKGNSGEAQHPSDAQNRQVENGREEHKPKKREYKRVSEADRKAFSIELIRLSENVKGTLDYQASVMDFSTAIQQLIWSRGGSPPQPNREMFPAKCCGCYPTLKASMHDDNLGALYWFCPKCQVKTGIGYAPIKRIGKNAVISGICQSIKQYEYQDLDRWWNARTQSEIDRDTRNWYLNEYLPKHMKSPKGYPRIDVMEELLLANRL